MQNTTNDQLTEKTLTKKAPEPKPKKKLNVSKVFMMKKPPKKPAKKKKKKAPQDCLAVAVSNSEFVEPLLSFLQPSVLGVVEQCIVVWPMNKAM